MQQDLISQAKKIIYSLLARREYSRQELANKLATKEIPQDIIDTILDEFANKNWQSDYRTAAMLLSHGYKSLWGPNKIRQQMHQKGISESIIAQVFNNAIKVEAQESQYNHYNRGNNSSTGLYAQKLDEMNSVSIENDSSNFYELKKKLDNQTSSDFSNSIYDLDFDLLDLEVDWYESANQAALKKFGTAYLSEISSKNDLKSKAKVQRFLYNRGFEHEQIDCVIKDYSLSTG